MASGDAYKRSLNNQSWHWPIIIKFCHLTQGWAASIKLIKSEEDLRQQLFTTLRRWVMEKWWLWPDDPHRPWRKQANMLTDTLSRGIMLQSGANPSKNPETGKYEMIEFKTEVIWGKAILAGIEFDNHKAELGAAGLFKTKDHRSWTAGIVTRDGNEGRARSALHARSIESFARGSSAMRRRACETRRRWRDLRAQPHARLHRPACRF